jgi:hypothetical protein
MMDSLFMVYNNTLPTGLETEPNNFRFEYQNLKPKALERGSKCFGFVLVLHPNNLDETFLFNPNFFEPRKGYLIQV